MRYPFASLLIADIGPSMGISVELEPEYQFAGELVFSNGRRHLFRNTNFNINAAGSTEIAKDKGYTSFFLRKHGLNVPESKAFFSEKLNSNLPKESRRGLSDAVNYAELIGFPVYIKPNNLSQGAFVTKVYSPTDVEKIGSLIFEKTNVLLIEEACSGCDYRIVVLGDEIISAYKRIPLIIVGDAKHTISELLNIESENLGNSGRPNSEIDPTDSRIDIKLRELGKSRDTVPFSGEKVVLLDNANLSTGGTSVDVTNSIHPSFVEISIKAVRVLGLQLCGVDILTDDLTKSAEDQSWNIIELNAAPGLDNYASIGEEQADRVKNLYRKILKYLENKIV